MMSNFYNKIKKFFRLQNYQKFLVVLGCYYYLLYVLFLKHCSTKYLAKFLQNKKQKVVKKNSPTDLSNIIDKIRNNLPYGENCLTISFVTFCLYSYLGQEVEFVYGVKENPFQAHAWVEDVENQNLSDANLVESFNEIWRV